MKKLFLSLGVLLLSTLSLQAQNQIQLSQYSQTAPFFNPALTGLDPFLDVKVGVRQQWTGFVDSPQTLFVSAFGSIREEDKFDLLKYSLRVSSPDYARKLQKEEFRRQGIRHGLGGYLVNDSQGALNQTKIKGNYSFQYPVGYNKYFSVGLTAGLNSFRIASEEISLRNPDIDPVYQSLIGGDNSLTFFEGGLGAAFYGDNFYIGYGAGRLINMVITGNETLQEDTKSIVHYVQAGYSFDINENFRFMPSAFVKSEGNTPLSFDVNAKIRYMERFWAGVGYRNDNSIIGMFGLSVNNMLNLSYSYDSSSADINTFNSGSHEIILGLMLFNNQNRSLSYLW